MTTTNPHPTICQTAMNARDLWERAGPVDPKRPVLEKRGIQAHDLREHGDDVLVPLWRDLELTPTNDDDPLGNLLIISPDGTERTVAIEQRSRNPNQETRKLYPRTKYVAAVFGKPVKADVGQLIGIETEYLGGNLAGASRAYLCVGWETAAKIHQNTGHPAVGVRSADEMAEVAKSMRRRLPAEVAITIATSPGHIDLAREIGEEIGARVVRL